MQKPVVEPPRAEQARIGTDLTAAQDRLADLDANLSEWQEILELAAAFATRCGDAYRKASDRTRRQFNAAVFTRLDVRDGRLCHEEYCPPFDDIFNVPEFEYGTRERATGIEPAFSAWEADVLPLNYAREPASHYRLARHGSFRPRQSGGATAGSASGPVVVAMAWGRACPSVAGRALPAQVPCR